MTPRARTGSSGHLNPKDFSVRFFQALNHMASVFLVLICNPLTRLNSSKGFSSLIIESQSLTSTVVSSAYCVIFISFWATLMPLISVSF